jgi:hypothetical protein
MFSSFAVVLWSYPKADMLRNCEGKWKNLLTYSVRKAAAISVLPVLRPLLYFSAKTAWCGDALHLCRIGVVLRCVLHDGKNGMIGLEHPTGGQYADIGDGIIYAGSNDAFAAPELLMV